MSEAKKSNLKDFSRGAPVSSPSVRVDLVYVIDKVNSLSDLYLSSISYLLNLNHFSQIQYYFEEFVSLAEKIEDEIDLFNIEQIINHGNKFHLFKCFKSDLHYTLTQVKVILEKINLLKVQIEGIEIEIDQPKVKPRLTALDNKLTHISNIIVDVIRNIESLNNRNISPLTNNLDEDNDKAILDIELRLEIIKAVVVDLHNLQKSKALLLNTITNK